MFALWRQSRIDYRSARGALHFAAIELALPKLERYINSTQSTLDALRRDMASLAARRTDEFKSVVAKSIVDGSTRGPPGVGPVLWERVVSSCFDGTLGSLRNPRGVAGIGDQRAAAINAWVFQAEREMQQMVNADFPGKREISERYETLLRNRRGQATAAEGQLRAALEIQVQAEKARQSLKRVSPATFRRAYTGEPLAAQQAIGFLLGVFPPWEKAPTWYQSLVGPGEQEACPNAPRTSPVRAAPLAFLLGQGREGVLVVEVRAQIEGKWVKIEDPLTLLSHGLMTRIQGSRVIAARESIGALLAIGSLGPRKIAEYMISVEPTPSILRYLREQKSVTEDDATKSIRILDTPLQRLATVDYNLKDGLHILTGYEVPGKKEPVPAESLRATPDGRFVQADGVFAPLPPPPSDAAAAWLKAPSRIVETATIPTFFGSDIGTLRREFRVVLSPEAERIRFHRATQLRCDVTLPEPDRLDLRISYASNGHVLPLSSVDAATGAFVRIGDYEWAELDLEKSEHVREGLRRLGARATTDGYGVDVAALARIEDLIRQAGGLVNVPTEVRSSVVNRLASRVPPFLFPDLSAFLARTVSRNVPDWKNIPLQEFARKLEQVSLDGRWLPDHIPPDLSERIFLPFYPVDERPGNGGDPPKRPTREFLEECMVKLKRLVYGEDDARLTFDPRLEGPHRETFVQAANYLESVLGRVESSLAKPYFCHTCGIYGESALLVLRREGRSTCLWCSRGLLVIAQRFRSLPGRIQSPL